MLDRDFFRHYRPMPSPFWEWVGSRSWRALQRVTRMRVVFEGFTPPPSPVIFATNSTQKYDFMPIRVELQRRNIPTVTLTKGKNYHAKVQGFLLQRLGVIPIISRGYVLLVDFTALLKRRPTEDEYRALRRHVDEGTPLPLAALAQTPRTVLGQKFEGGDYRAFVQRVYADAMAETVRLSREAVAAGAHVQIYPEGTVSSRLGQGRIGAVQLAHALGRPIVPVGMSGCREAMPFAGGTITVRFGEAFTPALPAGHVAFDPTHEGKHRAQLQAATDAVMDRIDALLDPPYRRLAGFAGDGTRGTQRFL